MASSSSAIKSESGVQFSCVKAWNDFCDELNYVKKSRSYIEDIHNGWLLDLYNLTYADLRS